MAYEILVAAISTGGVLGGTWLGAFLNRRSALDTAKQLAEVEQHKYAQSRLWDAKKEAFTQVIVELHTVDRMVDQVFNNLFDPETDPMYYLEAEESTKDGILLWQYRCKADDFVKNNSLILPDLFQAAFKAWLSDFENYDEESEPQFVVMVQKKAMDRHKPILIKLAKDDLAAAPKE